MNVSKIVDLLSCIWHCLCKAFCFDDKAELAREGARLTSTRLNRIRVMKESLPIQPAATPKMTVEDNGLSLPPELAGLIDFENPNFSSSDHCANLSRISQYRLAAYVATLPVE
ncbi:MAG: hypothetical protein KGS72_23570 [Cyanobacteria bacterium REEB67]|nr:hypothetical protein [Cyanobacteria bacterium REEB67]